MGNVIVLRPGPQGSGAGSWGDEEQGAEGGAPGEEEAARLVFLVHEPALRRRARRLTRGRDAEVLVRDTFELYLQHRDRAGGNTSLVVWLFAAMRELFVARAQQRRRLRVVGEPPPAGEGEPPVAPPTWAQVRRAQFRQALAMLPPDFRRVFELHAVEGLSYGQIGDRLQLTPLAVFARLCRARLLLKELLADRVGRETGGAIT